MRALLLALALATSTAAMAADEERERAERRGNTELCCILCGGWSALLVLTCPPCTFCAGPLFWLVGASGGECFKGTGDLDDLAFESAHACTDLLCPRGPSESPPAPSPAPDGDDDDDDDDQTAMSY